MQCSTDSFDDCDRYDFTTAAEEEEEAQPTKKRQAKRSFTDFVTWSAGMYNIFCIHFQGLLVKNIVLD